MRYFVLFSISTVISILGYAALRTPVKRRRLARLDFSDLLAQIVSVPVDGIAMVALDYLQPGKGQTEIGTVERWTMIGGYDGLRAMYANCEIMIALAGYAQRWNPGEGAIVAVSAPVQKSP